MTSPTSDPTARTETATFGGGCFWCTEAVFDQVRGVRRVVSGYAGGHVPHPTYEQVCSKTTGHAEVVQITYDPEEISFRELLEIHLTTHDPTTPNRQGADVGPQYRSAVFLHDEEQRRTTEAVIREFEEARVWDDPIVTQVEALHTFYPAEAYHQRYYERNPTQGYCRVVIAPKVAKVRAKFADKLAS